MLVPVDASEGLEGVVQALAAAASIRGGVSAMHSAQVAALSTAIAVELELPAATVELARLGGWLHDCGKVTVPTDILAHRGPLDEKARARMRHHAIAGEALVSVVPGLSGAAQVVRSHHERFDGVGYPDGLAGDEIPLAARIVAAADAFVAMTESRPYEGPRGHGEAIAELQRSSGSQFDPRVVDALVAVLEHERRGDEARAELGLPDGWRRRGAASRPSGRPVSADRISSSAAACAVALDHSPEASGGRGTGADRQSMFRLRTAAAVAAVLGTALSGLSASPAAAAIPLAACDAATAPGLQWSAPSFLAWGREARIGANVSDPVPGRAMTMAPSRSLSTPACRRVEQSARPRSRVRPQGARTRAATANAAATWTMVDETDTVRCAQTAALSVPLGVGKSLRYRPKAQGSGGITWAPVGAGDCHDIALEAISLTVSQGSATRRLNAADQCHPAGHQRVATGDWELVAGRRPVPPASAQGALVAQDAHALRAAGGKPACRFGLRLAGARPSARRG